MIGRTVSHYQIVGTLGSGGMGVVYKAIDIKLGRPVALKFLTEELSKDREAVLRFEREARASSALNDPGICTVYETDEADGQVFIAMELLEGESLHDRLQRGALPFDEAIDYALQLINALHAAHTKGILHRDIKPANIFLVTGRRAKLLDFGLAKIEEVSAPEMETVVRPMLSRVGSVAGTEAYMSPEQALGRPLDARSDLFSFGLVISEMATGRRVFAGPTAAVFDGILNRTPPAPSSIGVRLPGLFDFVVEKALRKDPNVRYQTAADLRADLRRLKETSATSASLPPPPVPHTAPISRLVVGAALTAIVAALVAVYMVVNRAGPAPVRPFLTDATFTQITDRPGLEASASLAPDGASVVYASEASGNWDIYWQRLDHATPINLTSGSTADDVDPAFAPDGQRVAFRSEREGGGIFLTDITGGAVRRLSNFCHNPAWSPDQASIACSIERVEIPSSRRAISPLWILDVATGGKRQLTTFDGVQPVWSPAGDRIAYWSYTPRSRIWTMPSAGGPPAPVTEGGNRDWNPMWSPDGRYLFFSSNRGGTTSNLWRVPIDPATGGVLGPVEPVTTPSSNAGFLSFSRDGSRMAYVDQAFTRNFSRLRLDRPGEPPVPVTRGAHVYRQLDLSPDQSRLAYVSDSRVFVMNADGTAMRQLTDTDSSRGPRWSPDGARIAFYSNRSGPNQIWMMNPDGSQVEQVTNFSDTKGVYYPVWSPDGRSMTSTSLEGLTLTADLSVPLTERKPAALPPLPTPGMSFVAWQWSADGSRLVGWKLLPDGQSAGIAIYDSRARTYRDITSAGIYPTFVRNGTALLIVVKEQLRLVSLDSLTVTGVPTPAGFGSDYTLSRDERSFYYAEDQREGNVWSITWPTTARPSAR